MKVLEVECSCVCLLVISIANTMLFVYFVHVACCCVRIRYVSLSIPSSFILMVFVFVAYEIILHHFHFRNTAAQLSLFVPNRLIIFSPIFCQSLNVQDLRVYSRAASFLYPVYDIV